MAKKVFLTYCSDTECEVVDHLGEPQLRKELCKALRKAQNDESAVITVDEEDEWIRTLRHSTYIKGFRIVREIH